MTAPYSPALDLLSQHNQLVLPLQLPAAGGLALSQPHSQAQISNLATANLLSSYGLPANLGAQVQQPLRGGVPALGMGSDVFADTGPQGAHAGEKQVCTFFLRTGTCAYGDRCKFKHPQDRVPPQLNSRGYPLRGNEVDCAHYMKKGWCAFGSTCKFNHPELSTPLLTPTYTPVPMQATYVSVPQTTPYATTFSVAPSQDVATAVYYVPASSIPSNNQALRAYPAATPQQVFSAQDTTDPAAFYNQQAVYGGLVAMQAAPQELGSRTDQLAKAMQGLRLKGK